MIKIINEEKIKSKNVIAMHQMKPLQVGKIVGLSSYVGAYVMRTASSDKFEVMNLTIPGMNKCWVFDKEQLNEPTLDTLKVEIIEETLTLEVNNK